MAERPGDLDVWVLAGQSNMQGCGWLHGVLDQDPRVWSFSTAGRWELATEPLHRLWESFTPVHQELMRPYVPEADRKLDDAELARREAATRKIGSGLGIAFGKAMADALSRPIGLVPAAHGGTSLEQWSPERKGLGGGSLYGAMLERIRRAGGKLRGILWYQGESDAYTADAGRSYADRFDRWIAAVRSDTGIRDLPVVVVQIGRVVEPADRAGVWPGWDLVREALGTLPDRTPRTAVTSAVDLPLSDAIHVGTPGLIRLGRRMARLALRLTDRPETPAGPQAVRIERTTTSAGGRNAVRVGFRDVTGGWSLRDGIRGFEARLPGIDFPAPLFPVNAWVDEATGTDIIVLLNRDAEPGMRLGYGLGVDPPCSLADGADMPLCSFLPRPVV
jgi:hypothetical protein